MTDQNNASASQISKDAAGAPVAMVSTDELRDIQSGRMGVPLRGAGWREDQNIALYLAAPVHAATGEPTPEQLTEICVKLAHDGFGNIRIDMARAFAKAVCSIAAPVHAAAAPSAELIEALKLAKVYTDTHADAEDAAFIDAALAKASAGAAAKTEQAPCGNCDGKGGWKTDEWIDPVSGPECTAERCEVCMGSGIEPASAAGAGSEQQAARDVLADAKGGV